jgi:hypothetical protein
VDRTLPTTEGGKAMTVRKNQPLLGQKGVYRINGLAVGITVVDVKNSYGQTRFLIEPLMGNGQVWVDKSSIQLESEIRGGLNVHTA